MKPQLVAAVKCLYSQSKSFDYVRFATSSANRICDSFYTDCKCGEMLCFFFGSYFIILSIQVAHQPHYRQYPLEIKLCLM